MNERLRELRYQALSLNDSPTKVGILEEAVRVADMEADEATRYDIRSELIAAATHSGAHEKAFVAFAWCLAYCDRAKDADREESLLWPFKWILFNVLELPSVSRERIAEMQREMRDRYQKFGYGNRAVDYLCFENAVQMGEFELARSLLDRWRDAPRDSMSDCPACERNAMVMFYSRIREDEAALREAQPIVAGKYRCVSVPQATFGNLVRPLLRLGKIDEAAAMYDRAYRRMSGNPEFLGEIAELLLLQVRLAGRRKATNLTERHFPWVLASKDSFARLRFFAAMSLLLESYERPTVKLKLPSRFSEFRDDGTYETAKLAEWLWQEAARLANQFDSRHANECYRQILEESRNLVR